VRIVPGLVIGYLSVVSVILMTQVVNTGQPIIEVIAGWGPPYGINLVFSAFTGFLVSLMTFMAFLIWLYSYRFKKIDDAPAQKYFILFMMLVTGSTGIVLTGDIFNLFVFMEITAIAAYSLTAFYRDRDGAEAGFKYLLIGSFASALMLLAIVLLYTQVGTLNMAEIAQRIHTVPQGMKITIFTLFMVGLGIEAEMFPLNGWAPDAYSQAPSPTSAAFAAVVSVAGIYALIRVTFTLFDVQGLNNYLMVMGFITMLIAEIAAIKQNDLKRMLAYSSVGQVGLVLIAFGIGSKLAIAGALFLMLNHGVIKSLLFMAGSYFIYNTDTKQLESLNGIHKKLPVVSFFFALGALAIVGFPPFSGFWSKFYILMAAADTKHLFLIIGILLVTIIEVTYYLRVVGRIYFAKEAGEPASHKPSINALIAMTILALFIIVIGIYPDFITNYVNQAADALLDKSNYINQILK
jgi:proton-translocating NADH-quinone oxidoreductase chain N